MTPSQKLFVYNLFECRAICQDGFIEADLRAAERLFSL